MTTVDRLKQIVKEKGLVRPRDLKKLNIPPDYLDRLYRQGVVERISRGVYAWPGVDFGEHQSLVEVSKQVPNGVVCLLSALSFFEIGTQQPHEVWLAISNDAWKPKIEYPAVRIVRYSDESFARMFKTEIINGNKVTVYSPAKTVADCFKFRNKLGIDVAIEALRECRRKKLATVDELWEAAKVCRMQQVMRPYMESLT